MNSDFARGAQARGLSEHDTRRLQTMIDSERAAGDAMGDQEELLPDVDLCTLLSEMTALKTEVRKETQSARELREQMGQAMALLQDELEQGHKLQASLEQTNEQQQARARKQTALAFIDLVDRLQPAVLHARELAQPRWKWFRKRRDRAAVSLLEGLELTLGRLTEQLSTLGVSRIATEGEPFDAELMQAVDTTTIEELPQAVVVEEITAGYRDTRNVLRLAQVVVNKKETNPNDS